MTAANRPVQVLSSEVYLFVLRTDGLDWTADHRLGRYLGESFEEAGKDKTLIILCAGDPDVEDERLGPWVGAELAPYYANVYGTIESPVRYTDLQAVWRDLAGPQVYIIGVEGIADEAEVKAGTIEVTDRGLKSWQPPTPFDLGVLGYVGADAGRLRPNEEDKLVQNIVDGFLRFLQKVGKYDPFAQA